MSADPLDVAAAVVGLHTATNRAEAFEAISRYLAARRAAADTDNTERSER